MDGTGQERVSAARIAVEARPDDLPARLRLAAVLLESGDAGAALEQFTFALARDPVNLEALRGAAAAAAAAGDAARAEAYGRLLNALGQATGSTTAAPSPTDQEVEPDEPVDTGVGFLRRPRLRAAHRTGAGDGPTDGRPVPALADVAGLEAVKRRLDVAFFAPLRHAELRKTYGKSLRGGLLLYGPPGCGKTFLARAAAGELGAKFVAVGPPGVRETWSSEGERKLHDLFEMARRNAPCLLFFDELDAIGHTRVPINHQGGRPLVNQLLAELDGIRGAANEGVFVLGATNHPWDVDVALMRPGRFDRCILVLPPDEPARDAILRYHLRGRPIDGLDVGWIATATAEFSGADLAHLCESAAEIALEASAANAAARPIALADFQQALADVRPTTRIWFQTARHCALPGSDSIYSDLVAYLRAPEALPRTDDTPAC